MQVTSIEAVLLQCCWNVSFQQDSDAPARSAKGEPTNVSSVIHSAITPNISQRGTPKVPNSKRQYSPLDVKFLSTPKTPKTPGSFQWSDEGWYFR